MMDLKEIETKLSAARTRLILEKPFLGALVMHLPLQAAEWCKTTATDARAFYFNPQFIDHLNLSQTQFMLAHEALHCALGHFARRSHRTKRRWDVACDHAVNQMLVEEGLKAPPGALMNPLYKHMTAEEIYPFIQAEPSEETIDDHLFDGDSSGDEKGMGAGENELSQTGVNRGQDEQQQQGKSGGANQADKQRDGKQDKPESQGSSAGNEQRDDTQGDEKPHQPGSTEKDELATQWRQRLASAAQQARQAGKLAESWMRLVDDLIQPKQPWRMLLARYMMSVAHDDYSFQRQSRREGDAMLPSLYSGQADIIVALDTSGSISDEEIREFISEVDAIKGQIRARIVLHACDEKLASDGPWLYESWEPVMPPKEISGGGGTDFRPVFEWVEREGLRPDLLIYFTDAEGDFPSHEPPYPVIWLVKGRTPVPWGQRVQLN